MGQNASNSMTFNIDQGYLEGLIRGFKGGILKRNDYLNLTQCETLDGSPLAILFDVFNFWYIYVGIYVGIFLVTFKCFKILLNLDYY